MQKLTPAQQEIFEMLCQCKNFEPNPYFLVDEELDERFNEVQAS